MKNRKVSDLPQITLETDRVTGNWTLVCRDLPGVGTVCSKLPKLRIWPLTSDCSEEHTGSVSFSSFTNRNLEHKCLSLGKHRLSERFESQGREWETLVPSRSYVRSDTKRLARQIVHTTATWAWEKSLQGPILLLEEPTHRGVPCKAFRDLYCSQGTAVMNSLYFSKFQSQNAHASIKRKTKV